MLWPLPDGKEKKLISPKSCNEIDTSENEEEGELWCYSKQVYYISLLQLL